MSGDNRTNPLNGGDDLVDHRPSDFANLRDEFRSSAVIPLAVATGVITPHSFFSQETGTPIPSEFPPPPPVTPGAAPERRDKPESVTFPFGRGDKLVDPALGDRDKWVIVKFSDGLSFKSSDPKAIADAKELKALLKEQKAGLISDVTFNVIITQPGSKVSFSEATYSVSG